MTEPDQPPAGVQLHDLHDRNGQSPPEHAGERETERYSGQKRRERQCDDAGDGLADPHPPQRPARGQQEGAEGRSEQRVSAGARKRSRSRHRSAPSICTSSSRMPSCSMRITRVGPVARRLRWLLLALLAGQALLGVLMVYLSLPRPLAVAHNVGAGLLLLAVAAAQHQTSAARPLWDLI
jgi:hypothetical protein